MRLRIRPLLPPSLALLLVAAALGGCGSSSSAGNGIASKSPEQIVAAAKAAADGAATVHIAGQTVSEGKPLKIDMLLFKGKGGRGRITLEGLSIDLIQIGRAVYINGNAKFDSRIVGPTKAQRLRGRWLKAPDDSGVFVPFAALTDLRALIDTTLGTHGKLANDGTKNLDGQEVVALRDLSSGETLYVAATGSAYPIEVVKDGGSGGKIIFDRWNKPVTLTAPANAININQLQSGR